MTEKRFTLKHINEQHISANLYDNGTFIGSIGMGEELIVELLNTLSEENEQLKSDLKDCKNLKRKRLNKIRNHRAVIEDLGGSIRAYKGKIEQTNEKIDKIKEAMEDTGALTKRQLEEILND